MAALKIQKLVSKFVTERGNSLIRNTALFLLIAVNNAAAIEPCNTSEVDKAVKQFNRSVEEWQLQNLKDPEKNWSTVGEAIYHIYENSGLSRAEERMGCLSDAELLGLLESIKRVAFYNPDSDNIYARSEAIFSQIVKREALESSAIETMFNLYIAARMFNKAERLRNQYGSKLSEPLPNIPDLKKVKSSPNDQAPTLLHVDAYDSVLTEKIFEKPNEGRFVYVVSSPVCPWSRQAVNDIRNHTTLKDFFSANSLWLFPQSKSLHIEGIRNWNSEFPYETKIIKHQRHWPEIKSFVTPTFYIYEDGAEIASFHGWGEGSLEDLEEFID